MESAVSQLYAIADRHQVLAVPFGDLLLSRFMRGRCHGRLPFTLMNQLCPQTRPRRPGGQGTGQQLHTAVASQ